MDRFLAIEAFVRVAETRSFAEAARSIGFEVNAPMMNIVLPIGISFYTFVTLSYTLDVYLRRAKPAKSFLDYALFVTFFPQLVAGPIVDAVTGEKVAPLPGTLSTQTRPPCASTIPFDKAKPSPAPLPLKRVLLVECFDNSPGW